MQGWIVDGMGGTEEESTANEYQYLCTENRNLVPFQDISSTGMTCGGK
jgi:hypothetical protein